jgi:hypothetical protein
MKLLTKAIEKTIPALYSGENTPLAEKKIVVKFFDPTGSWTWYAVEASAVRASDEECVPLNECVGAERKDVMFFGLVDGHEKEWGYFTLAQLTSVKGRLGIGIERDLHFGTPTCGEAGVA